MLRQSPSRNQRSKGVKVKHVLQICLLLAVCFWLIYQVKHSHDKRKEFDEHENGVKNLEKPVETLRLGRKGLPQEDKKVIDSEKHEEEEVEEEETGGGEEENKNEEVEEQEQEQEQEQGENKNEEKEDEERGAGDDEIDELDQEKTEGEAGHEEDFIDEEKEREEESEEKDFEEKGRQTENEDHDGSDGNTHEAREEHYKADDASSEVAHDTDTINTELERISMENADESADSNVLEQEHKSNDTQEINDQTDSVSKLGEGQMAQNSSLIVTAGEEKGNDTILLKSEDSSLLNLTITTVSNDQPELNNNSTELRTENPGASLQNGTETIADSTQIQNVTVEGAVTGEGAEQAYNSSTADDGKQSDFNSTLSTKMEDTDTLPSGYKNSSSSTEHAFSENITISNRTVEANDSSESLTSKENADATQNEKSDFSDKTGTTYEESSDSSSLNENADTVQHDHGDSSDSVLQEEKENRIDVDTLPEIATEGSGNEDAATE